MNKPVGNVNSGNKMVMMTWSESPYQKFNI